MELSVFPALNASLNAVCAALLLLGWGLIKTGRRAAHRRVMIAAVLCGVAFLSCYLWYHLHVGSVRFQKTGAIRTVYFSVLITHTVLAAAVLPMILRTLFLAVRQRFDEHRRWARWTFPIWLYVSVTGVAVYWMLYRL